MANILEVKNGTTTLLPTTTWAAPNSLFGATDRNDGSVYGWADSTSTITLPASDLADGYMVLWGFEFEDTSNGRHNPQGRMIQASGTGNFASAATGGYNRDNSEDRSYVSGWSFIDSPSASATLQFQWRRDTDAPTGGTVRSFIQVIPLYYSDVGIYTSTSTTATGGTTPVQIGSLTGTDGTNITVASSTVTMTGDNKRYLVLGAAYHQGIGNARTQRWYGLRVDGIKDDAAKGCQYYRQSSDADGGESFIRLLETVTASRTVDLFQYRGDGVGAGQGGADVDGNTTGANSQHALVVIELNDSAEVYSSVDSVGGQEFALAGPVDVDIASTGDIEFSDAASFVRVSDTAVNVEVTADVFAFANVSHAREASSIGSGSRWTVHGEFTINGTEVTDVGFHGNYNRGNQTSTDCMGSSCNQAAVFAITADQDIGVSNQELSGTEGGNGDIETQPGWVGFGLINLDTLPAAGGGDTPLNGGAGIGTTAITGTPAATLDNPAMDAVVGAYAITGVAATTTKHHIISATYDAENNEWFVSGTTADLLDNPAMDAGIGAYTITGVAANTEDNEVLNAIVGAYTITGIAATTDIASVNISFDGDAFFDDAFDIAAFSSSTTSVTTMVAAIGAYTITGTAANLLDNPAMDAGIGTYAISGVAANTEDNEVLNAIAGAYTITGIAATTSATTNEAITADVGTYAITGVAANLLDNPAMDASIGTYAITGAAANLLDNPAMDAGIGTYTITGVAATTTYNASIVMDAGIGSYAITGTAANTEDNEVLNAVVGTYAITGAAANLLDNPAMDASIGAYAINGTAANTENHQVLSALVGTYTITGAAANLLDNPAMDAGIGAYTITGIAANTEDNEVLNALVGTYTITGVAATTAKFTYSFDGDAFDNDAFDIDAFALTAASGDITLVAATGAYTITGIAANTEDNEVLNAAVGTYTITGVAANLLDNPAMDAGIGTYIVTGIAATTTYNSTTVITADAGTYDITGTAANLLDNPAMDAGIGAYTISGVAANTEDNEVLNAVVGTYTITGIAATTDIVANQLLTAEVGAYNVTGIAATTAISTNLLANTGTYVVTGFAAATFDEPFVISLIADSGSVNVTGLDNRLLAYAFDNLSFAVDSFDFNSFWISSVATIVPEIGEYNVISPVANLTKNAAIFIVDSGTYNVTGVNATLLDSSAFNAEIGTFVINAPAVDLSESVTAISADAGTYTIASVAPNTYPADGMVAIPFSVNYAGLDPDSPFNEPWFSSLVAGDIVVRDLTTTPDALNVTSTSTGLFTVDTPVNNINQLDYFIYTPADGNAGTTEQIFILRALEMPAVVGTYTITGPAATTSTVGSVVTNADSGTYDITGIAATTTIAPKVNAEVGTFIITEFDAQTIKNRLFTAEVGTYNVGAPAANTEHHEVIVPVVGTYTIFGTEAGLSVSSSLITAEVGTYSIAGPAIATLYNKTTIADVGVYTINGLAADTFASSDSLAAGIGAIVVTGTDAGVFAPNELLIPDIGAYTVTGPATDTYASSDDINALTGTYTISSPGATTIVLTTHTIIFGEVDISQSIIGDVRVRQSMSGDLDINQDVEADVRVRQSIADDINILETMSDEVTLQ